jgi:hypothetical protein
MPGMPQSFSNHTRLDPWFHFFLLPVFGLGVLFALINFVAHFAHRSTWGNVHACLLIVLALALLVAVVKIRTYPLKVQDRVIRLEERLRLQQLLAEPLRSRIPDLTEDQLIALRFATDGEVAKLAERALNEKLTRKQIKQAIKNWRPDNWRV